jgi:glycosyltransferase involved in cell wall biosynthesis
MKLLFITQKLHAQDAFGVLWATAFSDAGYDVTVICLEDRRDLAAAALGGAGKPFPFQVRSFGKERGAGKIAQILTFWRLIRTLDYDRVFIHMSPVWGLLGAWYWWPADKPTYLWYTHYKMQAGLRLLGWYGRRLFCATPQSLPQYEGSSKRVVTGHGIDMAYWPKRPNVSTDPTKLLCVHRLSRSKRLEIVLHAMTLLPDCTLDIYGIDAEADYAAEMRALTAKLGLAGRVSFRGTVLAKDLARIYASHRLILNMASETIDKSMLEAMTCGCYPVTTAGNAKAIGIPAAPADDTPETLAAFVRRYAEKPPIDADAMFAIIAERHSLSALIAKMDSFIRPGI